MVEREQGRRSGCVGDEVGEMEAGRNRMGLKFKSKCLVLIQWEINWGGAHGDMSGNCFILIYSRHT